MSIEELEKISAAICDSHKCGASFPNRRATIIWTTPRIVLIRFVIQGTKNF